MDSSCKDEHIDCLHVDVEGKVKALGGNKTERVATWNISG